MKREIKPPSRFGSESVASPAHLLRRCAFFWAGLVALAALAFAALFARADVSEAWVHRYNAPLNSNDVAQAVAVDRNGNVVVTGYSHNGAHDNGDDYYTAKYAAADGALLWEKRYNGPANGQDQACAVAVDGNGNVVVTGYSYNSNDADFYTAKYAAADGALLWEKRYDSLTYPGDFAHGLAVDSSDNVVVTGRSGNGFGNDYYTVKYAAADGALLWEKRYDGQIMTQRTYSDWPYAVKVDRSDNVIVTGSSYANGWDLYTAKYAAVDGALLWEKSYVGPFADDYSVAMAIDGSGNVVVTGQEGRDGWIPGFGQPFDYYTAKYAAADGTLLWEKRYNGPANHLDAARAVAVDGSGNAVVTGSSHNGTNYDSYTAKYAAADGTLLWEKRYNGPGNTDDYASAVAVDGSGNVVVTGYSNNGTNFDYYTAKYAAGDGTLLWEKRYNGPANGDDLIPTPRCLALGPNGMVAITGSSCGSFNSVTNTDFATVVYREALPPVSLALVAEGVLLRFPGVPGRSYDVQRAPAATGPWNIIATLTAPASGLLEYIDTPPPPGQAFYRTRSEQSAGN